MARKRVTFRPIFRRSALTAHGKRWVAHAMYADGRQFLGAAVLLSNENRKNNTSAGGHVIRHLFCQGVELTLKGLLLAHDYDDQAPRLKKFSHNLEALVAEGSRIADRPVSLKLSRELKALNGLYSRSLFRYAGEHRLFVHAQQVPYANVFKRVLALMKVVERRNLI